MNELSPEKRAAILDLLCHGNTVRYTAAHEGVSINTVLNLLVLAGAVCRALHERMAVDLASKRVEVDENWSFSYCKQANLASAGANLARSNKTLPAGSGDVWTWTAIDRDHKFLISLLVGLKGLDYSKPFIADLKDRVRGRIQLTSDASPDYFDAVEISFGKDIDYAHLIKVIRGHYDPATRQKTQIVIATSKRQKLGNPDRRWISTSIVERQNLNFRHFMRRYTRETLAFSKKWENHQANCWLYLFFHNYIRQHHSLRKLTPAMSLGVTKKLWEFSDLVREIDKILTRERQAIKVARAAERTEKLETLKAGLPVVAEEQATHVVVHNLIQRSAKVHTVSCRNGNRRSASANPQLRSERHYCEDLDSATAAGLALAPDRFSTCALCIKAPDGSSARRRRLPGG